MADAIVPIVAKKVAVTIDVRIEAEPHYSALRCWHAHKDEHERIECRVKSAEKWAREFMEFVRDHRSQDLVGLDVVRVTEAQCSECHAAWETSRDPEWGDEHEHCVNCGVRVSP